MEHFWTLLSLLEPRSGQATGAGSAAQPGRALTAPTFLALKTGWEQDALLFSVWELERDLQAVPGMLQPPGLVGVGTML